MIYTETVCKKCVIWGCKHMKLTKEQIARVENILSQMALEDGLFRICAGGNSRDLLEEEITVRF